AERRDRRRHPGDQRPPAVRAEEAELAGALADLRGGAVLGPEWQPAAGEQEVEAGEEGEPHGHGQCRGPGGVLGEMPVDDVNGGEERGAADEQVPLDLHASPLSCRAGPCLPCMPGLTGAPRWTQGLTAPT